MGIQSDLRKLIVLLEEQYELLDKNAAEFRTAPNLQNQKYVVSLVQLAHPHYLWTPYLITEI